MKGPLRVVGPDEAPPDLPPGACERCAALEEELAHARDMVNELDRLLELEKRRSAAAENERLRQVLRSISVQAMSEVHAEPG